MHAHIRWLTRHSTQAITDAIKLKRQIDVYSADRTALSRRHVDDMHEHVIRAAKMVANAIYADEA